MNDINSILDRLDKILSLLDAINLHLDPPPSDVRLNKSINPPPHDYDDDRSNKSIFIEIMMEEGMNPNDYDLNDKSAAIDYFVSNLAKINNRRSYLRKILPSKKTCTAADNDVGGVPTRTEKKVGFRQVSGPEVAPGVPLYKGAFIYRDDPDSYTDHWLPCDGMPGGYVHMMLKRRDNG